MYQIKANEMVLDEVNIETSSIFRSRSGLTIRRMVQTEGMMSARPEHGRRHETEARYRRGS